MTNRDIAEHEAGHIWWALMFCKGKRVAYYNFRHKNAKKNPDCKRFLKKAKIKKKEEIMGCAHVSAGKLPCQIDAELMLAGILTSKVLDHNAWRRSINLEAGDDDLRRATNLLENNNFSTKEEVKILNRVERVIRDNIENIIFLSKFLVQYPFLPYRTIKAFWDGHIAIKR
jgi:hypothetical protein